MTRRSFSNKLDLRLEFSVCGLFSKSTKSAFTYSYKLRLSPEDLQYFAEGLGLDVASSKKADLIGCIVAQTDFATPAEKKARKKPAIDAKITAKQLNQHYTQATIARWLRQNEISDAGSKAVCTFFESRSHSHSNLFNVSSTTSREKRSRSWPVAAQRSNRLAPEPPVMPSTGQPRTRR